MSDRIDELVQDAQRVIKQVTEVVRAADRAFESSGGSSRHWVREQFIPRLEDAGLRIVPAAYIERLEAERVIMRNGNVMTQEDYEWLAMVRDELMLSQEKEARKLHALLAEHEAWKSYVRCIKEAIQQDDYELRCVAAHDNAERVIHGE